MGEKRLNKAMRHTLFVIVGIVSLLVFGMCASCSNANTAWLESKEEIVLEDRRCVKHARQWYCYTRDKIVIETPFNRESICSEVEAFMSD